MTLETETGPPQVRHVRAWFAPVLRSADSAAQPALFDPAVFAATDLDELPAPWIALGPVTDFARHTATTVEPLRTGSPAVVRVQARTQIEATVSFRFQNWGKLQLALAGGTQLLNVLATASGPPAAGSGGGAVEATALQPGSTGTVLQLGVAAANFAAGSLVAVDVDNSGQTGFLGAGASGAYLRSPVADVDYIRRITFNVARVASTGNGALTLADPLLAGAPGADMKVSPVTGFCDREGSTFFQEWSAVFASEGQQGERVLWHYPRLQTMSGIAEATSPGSGGYETLSLAAALRALPVVDPVDGETVLCFRSYNATWQHD